MLYFSRQKRKSVDPVDEYEGNADINIFSNMTLGVNYRIKNISVSPKELSNFGKLSEDAQKNCIKAVSRLFVLKGIQLTFAGICFNCGSVLPQGVGRKALPELLSQKRSAK